MDTDTDGRHVEKVTATRDYGLPKTAATAAAVDYFNCFFFCLFTASLSSFDCGAAFD